MTLSFCIITNAARPEKLRATLESIRAQGVDREIILSGATAMAARHVDLAGVRCLELTAEALAGLISHLRNRAVTQASKDLIVVMDDDIVLRPGWAAHVAAAQEAFAWDVLCTRLLNPDGTRYWDWASAGGPRGHVLLDYGDKDGYVYVTGGLSVQKPYVRDFVRWPEDRGFGDNEDGVFSERLREASMVLGFCKAAEAIHNDATLTQEGRLVVRKRSGGV